MRNVRWMGKSALFVGLLATVAATSGCKKLLSKKGGDAGTTTTSGVGASSSGGAATAQDDADDKLQEKIDEYIKCLNSLSSSIHSSRHRYFTYISPKTGPTGKETYADLYKLPAGAATKCKAGITKAKTQAPSDPKLEGAGEEFANAAVEIDTLINEADKYYENKDFRDDKWAKGKALHPKLVAAWQRFSKADSGLHGTLDGITKPLAQRVLARIEREEGKKFSYHRKHVLISGRELVEASDPVGEDDDVDFNLFNASYTEFEKALEELTTYGAAHKADLSSSAKVHTPAWPMAESNYDRFIKEAGEFKKASKEYWRCLRDAPAAAKTPSGKIDVQKIKKCEDGAPGKIADEVVKQYNEFIRTSNSSQFP